MAVALGAEGLQVFQEEMSGDWEGDLFCAELLLDVQAVLCDLGFGEEADHV